MQEGGAEASPAKGLRKGLLGVETASAGLSATSLGGVSVGVACVGADCVGAERLEAARKATTAWATWAGAESREAVQGARVDLTLLAAGGL